MTRFLMSLDEAVELVLFAFTVIQVICRKQSTGRNHW
jgi:FlaA1/EpsC-like NDP-sugar epimerase